ncbi:DUF1176 domain-containing protein [Baaleninema simplex]|uniref:DUF1176 domain-containing protein n=1 Tax=Baaleninema simplex TaxID=2862350 RepID=UPI00034535E1|nr:DUF1176 domain-containing protein [Baaleninema simplex]
MNKYQISIGCIFLGIGIFVYVFLNLNKKTAGIVRSDSSETSSESPDTLELEDQAEETTSFSSMFFPPSSEPPYPDISNASDLSIELLDYLYENIEELDVCDGRLDFFANRRYPRLYEVAEQRYIVELVCGLGAYNIVYQYFLYESQPEASEMIPLTFDQFKRDDYTEESARAWVRYQHRDICGRRVYDTEEQIFNFFCKGIGQATCGDFARYQWDNVESRFQLLEYRTKEDCYSTTRVFPEQYPLIYQAP